MSDASSAGIVTKPFLTDIKTIRERARKHVLEGAVTDDYKADRAQVVKILNEALATEIVCVLRYKSHYYRATGVNAQAVKSEFLEHAKEEQEHADKIAERITQLNGDPDFNPQGLHTRSHADFVAGESLVEMIQEDLIAERIAIETYREIVQYLGHDDPTTSKLLKHILAQEEEHAEDLKTMLENLGDKGEPAKKAGVEK